MPVTVLVEPDPGGHRFQYVRHVVDLARVDGEVILLTTRGAAATAEFAAYLDDAEVKVEECFDEIRPPTRLLAEAIADQARSEDVAQALVLDADQALKRWWREAPRAFRGLDARPRVVFLLTRYPARLTLDDRLGWAHRVSKASLALLARGLGTLDRTFTLAGRDDPAPGRLVARVRDPAICSAHSRDRASLRVALALPADRRLVGVFGVINDRKNVPLVFAAIEAAGPDIDLVLAGAVDEEVERWLAGLPEQARTRVHVRNGFLDNDELDRHVAAVDVCAVAQNNNGPSGIMGKALAAGTPVLSAGSVVRARELALTGGGISAGLEPEPLATGLRQLLDGSALPTAAAPLEVGAEHFAAALLAPRRSRWARRHRRPAQ